MRLLLLALLFAPTAATADAPPAPVDVSGEQLETITFTRLVLNDVDGRTLGLAADSFRIEFIEAMRAAGHQARGAESVLFGKDSSREARFLLGGTVEKIEWTRTAGMRLELTVEWQLFDTRRDEVVYRVVTRGLVEDGANVPLSPVALEALDRAFASLLSREPFVDQLRPSAATPSEVHWDDTLVIRRCEAPSLTLPADMDKALAGATVLRAGSRLGSGVIVSPDGYLLTAAHVISGADAVDVQTHSGLSLPAQVLRVDTFQDIALLKLAGSGHRCLGLGAGDPPLGAELFAIGSPTGARLEFSISKGVVSGVRNIEGVRYLQTDASINGGNSGGPLLNERGRVVGIVSWKIAAVGFEGLGFGVPVDAVNERLGLGWGDTSDPDPAAKAGRVGVSAVDAGLVVDEPDVSRFAAPREEPRAPKEPAGLDEPSSASTSRSRSSGPAVRIAGAATAAAGALLVGGTWAYHQSDPRMSTAQWTSLQAVNTLGWVALAGGATGVVVGTTLGGGPAMAVGGRW